ncbi:DUF998 domain-containing protein [Spirillospora sp. NPDC050679]
MTLQTRTPLWCGAIAGPLFTLVCLTEGAVRADYDPLRHPVSSLALTDRGWVQILNFLLAGTLTITFAVGLRSVVRRSVWGPLLIGLFGAGLLGAGAFVTDPVGGYPPGTPDRMPDPTTHGSLHDGLSLASFVALTAACLVFARSGSRSWRLYCLLSGLGFAAVMLTSSVTFGAEGSEGDLAGLLQRIAITTAWTWQTVLAVRLLREGRLSEGEQSAAG